MDSKFLIALQHWEGDKAQTMNLAKFLADLEPKHTDLADFLLISRFDCWPEPGIEKYLARKFNTFLYTTPRGNVGWPDGCNSLWNSTMEWAYCMIEAKKVPHYKAIFCCEGDGGPVSRDWIAQMSAAWDEVNKAKPVVMAGPLVFEPAEHINGNCLLSCDLNFLRRITRGPNLTPPRGGWDFVMASWFKAQGWANIKGMKSYYNTPNFTVEQYKWMQKEKIIWVHGDKSNALVKLGRLYLLETGNVPQL